jgi:hypothetical protein
LILIEKMFWKDLDGKYLIKKSSWKIQFYKHIQLIVYRIQLEFNQIKVRYFYLIWIQKKIIYWKIVLSF